MLWGVHTTTAIGCGQGQSFALVNIPRKPCGASPFSVLHGSPVENRGNPPGQCSTRGRRSGPVASASPSAGGFHGDGSSRPLRRFHGDGEIGNGLFLSNG